MKNNTTDMSVFHEMFPDVMLAEIQRRNCVLSPRECYDLSCFVSHLDLEIQYLLEQLAKARGVDHVDYIPYPGDQEIYSITMVCQDGNVTKIIKGGR